MGIELMSGHTGFNGDVEVLGTDSHDAGHPAEIEADAATNGTDMPLQRRSRPKWNNRHMMLGADANDLGDLFGRFGITDGIRGLDQVVAFTPAVMLAIGDAGGETASEQRRETFDDFDR